MEGEGVMEPGDMPLMLPFCDTRYSVNMLGLVKSLNVDRFTVNVTFCMPNLIKCYWILSKIFWIFSAQGKAN